MRTYHKILGLVAVLALFAVGTAVVLAQSQDTNMANRHMNQDQLQMGAMSGNCGCGLDTPLMNRTAMHTAMAEALGLSLEELEAALADGTRLPHLMAELDVDPEAVRTAMREARETAVAEALADGTISQEQADCILNKTERGPHFHGHGHGRHTHDRPQNHGRMGQ